MNVGKMITLNREFVWEKSALVDVFFFLFSGRRCKNPYECWDNYDVATGNPVLGGYSKCSSPYHDTVVKSRLNPSYLRMKDFSFIWKIFTNSGFFL